MDTVSEIPEDLASSTQMPSLVHSLRNRAGRTLQHTSSHSSSGPSLGVPQTWTFLLGRKGKERYTLSRRGHPDTSTPTPSQSLTPSQTSFSQRTLRRAHKAGTRGEAVSLEPSWHSVPRLSSQRCWTMQFWIQLKWLSVVPNKLCTAYILRHFTPPGSLFPNCFLLFMRSQIKLLIICAKIKNERTLSQENWFSLLLNWRLPGFIYSVPGDH